MSQNLTLEITPAHTITVAQFQKYQTKQEQKEKIYQIGKINLENTLQILKWNVAQDIYVYRLSSKLIPLATWKDFPFSDFSPWKKEFLQIGEYVKKHNLRVSAHPDHFSVINTPREEVFTATIKELVYHDQFLTEMGLGKEYKLVVHVGGKYGDKIKGIEQFIHRFKQLPRSVQERLIIENDDKTYTASEVLGLCQRLKVPMVLDAHHFMVNHEEESLSKLLPDIFATWKQESFPPKVHFSTPRNEKEIRAHAEYIQESDFISFLQLASSYTNELDVMLEAKAKDKSLLCLRQSLIKEDKRKKHKN